MMDGDSYISNIVMLTNANIALLLENRINPKKGNTPYIIEKIQLGINLIKGIENWDIQIGYKDSVYIRDIIAKGVSLAEYLK